MTKQIIITDLDRTAVDSPDQKHPSERLVSAIQKLDDKYYVCAATGRSRSFALPLMQEMKLHHPCIVAGGTSIVDPTTGKLLWQQAIEAKSLTPILEIMKDSGFKILFDDYTEEDYLCGGWSFERIANIKEAYFLELVFVPEKDAHSLAKKFHKIPNITATVVTAQRPGKCDIHIINEQATKEHAISELCKMLGVDQSRSIGIGDGHNDLHLFQGVTYKVAMGNAVKELKDASDEVIGSIQEDGLAEYFEKLAGD